MLPVRVSVIMPVYNDGAFVGEAIHSILNQTFQDFELIILDDGSTDTTNDIVTSFKDERIRHFKDDKNRGPAYRRNQGLKASRGDLIALMDGDDLAPLDRLAVSVAAMDAHLPVGILGGQAQLFDQNGPREIWKFPLHHGEICARMFFRGSFSNPSLILRASVIREQGIEFDSSLWLAEDYLLWYQMLRVSQGMNLKHILVNYRVSPSQLTQSRVEEKFHSVAKVHAKMVAELGISDFDSDKHQSVISNRWEPSQEFFQTSCDWLVALIRANRKSKIFPSAQFEAEILDFLYYRCRTVPQTSGLVTYCIYRQMLNIVGRTSFVRLGKLLARDLLIGIRKIHSNFRQWKVWT